MPRRRFGVVWVANVERVAVVAAALPLVGVVGPSSPAPAEAERGPAIGGPSGASEAAIVPVTPARVLDTRAPTGVDVAGSVGAGGVVELEVAGRGGVPGDGAARVVLNVTIAAVTAPTFVTVRPAGEKMPNASSLNALPGQVFANLVVAKVGEGGSVSLGTPGPHT